MYDYLTSYRASFYVITLKLIYEAKKIEKEFLMKHLKYFAALYKFNYIVINLAFPLLANRSSI